MSFKSLTTEPELARSLRTYAIVGGLALVCRAALILFPAQALTRAQAELLRWPLFLSILVLGFPAMHLARKWMLAAGSDGELRWQGKFTALALGTACAALLIAIDLIFLFPRDMNLIGLGAVPFYVVGAFLVEVVQHLVPLALWLGVVGRLLCGGKLTSRVFWIGALLVGLFEPASQLGGGYFEGYPMEFFVFAGVIFYAVNLAGLHQFQRGGFQAMFAYRLGLYLIWHIVWGPVRLRLLF